MNTVMWSSWILLVLGSVHTFALDSIPDTPVDISDDLIQNVTTVQDNYTTSTSQQTSTEFTTPTEDEDVEFPYMAAILHVSNTLLGAGAIVGEKWVLVTGFQMGAFKPDQLRVRVNSNSALSKGELLVVDRLYPHPMYSQFNNDVALLKTAEDIKDSTLTMVPIATRSPKLGDSASFIMWNTEFQVQSSQGDIVTVAECKVFYPDFELAESNICVMLDHSLPYSVVLYGSPLVVKGSLIGLYMGLGSNTFTPYLCSNLAPLRRWVQRMMSNENETLSLNVMT